MNEVPNCPICHKTWQFLQPFNDETYWAHYCETAKAHIGWRMNGRPVVIPDDCVFENPPEAR